MSKQISPWFSGSVRPARVGVYEVSFGTLPHNRTWFSYWDGLSWGWLSESAVEAHNLRSAKTPAAVGYWRGLSAPPDGQAAITAEQAPAAIAKATGSAA